MRDAAIREEVEIRMEIKVRNKRERERNGKLWGQQEGDQWDKPSEPVAHMRSERHSHHQERELVSEKMSGSCEGRERG